MAIKSYCDNCKAQINEDTCSIVDSLNILLCLECLADYEIYSLFRKLESFLTRDGQSY